MVKEIHLVSKSVRRRLKMCLGDRPGEADVPRLLSVLANDSLGMEVKIAAKLELSRRYFLGINDALSKLKAALGAHPADSVTFKVNERVLHDPLSMFTDEEAKKQMAWHFKRADLWLALKCENEMAVPWLALSLHHMHFDFPYGSMAMLDQNSVEYEFSESMYAPYARDTVFVGMRRVSPVQRERPASHPLYESRWSFEVKTSDAHCFHCERRLEHRDPNSLLTKCPGSAGYRSLAELYRVVHHHGCHAYRSELTEVKLENVMLCQGENA